MRAEIFLDAAYAIALASPNDYFHEQAVHLARQLQQSKTCLVTTRAVILEIGNALSKQRHRQDAVTMLRALETDPKRALKKSPFEIDLSRKWGKLGQ